MFSETVGPGLAVYNLSSVIYLAEGQKSLSESQIDTMQDDLQHIHHNAGYMSLALQPSQARHLRQFSRLITFNALLLKCLG